ncbi:G5 domain-containing protein [Bacillus sp. A301a_S52]|nr:G5 domain-containing protein [Bacillus sp. A301a_S52]
MMDIKYVTNKKWLIIFFTFVLIIQIFALPSNSLAAGDSTPPVLESVEISPKEVNVGDTIKIKAKISDDFSGVRFAHVAFKSPSEERNHSIHLNENEETGYWEGSYVVQDFDESGEWKLQYIYVIDNAGNRKNYQPTEIETNINFIINNSNGDSTPPVLESVEISPKEVNVGDTIKIKAKISDDFSGVRFAHVAFKSPSEERNHSIHLNENEETGYWEGSYVVQDFDESGEWKLQYIYVIDNAGNRKNYQPTEIETNINFIINNSNGDSTPPVLESVEISPKEVNVGDTIKIKAKISDDFSGVRFAHVAFKSPSEERNHSIHLNENEETGYWEGSYVVQDFDESGEWKLQYIYVIDNAGNRKNYPPNEVETNINFIINNSNDDSSGEENGTDPEEGKDSDNDDNEELPYQIVISDETWSNKIINKDVFIGPEAILSINGNVTVNGNIYVYGVLRSFDGLSLNGTLYAQQMNFGIDQTLYQGSANISGSNSISSVIVSSEAYDVPLDAEYEFLEQSDNLFIQGKTLPFLDVYIDDKKVDVMGNGSFSKQLSNYNNTVTIVIRDIFGKDIVKYLNLGLEEIIEEVEIEEIPYETIKKEDPTLKKGEEVVEQEGVPGEKVITYEVTYANDEEIQRVVISEEITNEPVNKIIRIGTKVDESNEGSEGENGSDPEDGDSSEGEKGSDPENGDGSEGEKGSDPENGDGSEGEKGSDPEDGDSSEETTQVFPKEDGFHFSDDGTIVSVKLSSKDELALTVEQVNVLIENNQSLEVIKDGVTLSIPSSVFGNDEPSRIIVYEIGSNPNSLSSTYDLTIKQENKIISEFDEGVTLTLNVDTTKAENPNNLKVFYKNEEIGEWENIGGQYNDKNSTVTVLTNHFSTFTVFEAKTEGLDNTIEIVQENPKPETEIKDSNENNRSAGTEPKENEIVKKENIDDRYNGKNSTVPVLTNHFSTFTASKTKTEGLDNTIETVQENPKPEKEIIEPEFNENNGSADTEPKENETGNNVKSDNLADNTLPNTDTNSFKFMLIGLITLLASVSIALFIRFKRSKA